MVEKVTTSADSFIKQINNFKGLLERRSKALEGELKSVLMKQVIERSPVKTGFFKSQWEFVGADQSVQGAGNVVQSGFNFDAVVLRNLTFYGPSMFINPETGQEEWGLEAGRSSQAPQGMITPAVPFILDIWPVLVNQVRTTVR